MAEQTLDQLRADHEAAAQCLAAAEAAEAARPAITEAEAQAIFVGALVAHESADNRADKHAVAVQALQALEVGKHKGREVDILAQFVLDHREEKEVDHQVISLHVPSVRALVAERSKARAADDKDTVDVLTGILSKVGVNLADRDDGTTDWSIRV